MKDKLASRDMRYELSYAPVCCPQGHYSTAHAMINTNEGEETTGTAIQLI